MSTTGPDRKQQPQNSTYYVPKCGLIVLRPLWRTTTLSTPLSFHFHQFQYTKNYRNMAKWPYHHRYHQPHMRSMFDLQHALKGANMESEVCSQCRVLISSAHFPVVISHENISAQDMRTACLAASTRQLHQPCKWAFITANNHQLAGSLGGNVIVQCEAVRMTACFLPKRQCSCSCGSLHESIKPR